MNTDKEFMDAIWNQELIEPTKASRLMSKIVEQVGGRLVDGTIQWYNRPCEVKFVRNRREVQFHNNGVYQYITNPRYREEHTHVIGLQDNFDGIYNDGENKYWIENYKPGYAFIYKLRK